METKFTAGPWSVPHFARPDVNCECGYVLCDDHMGAIATVHCSGDLDCSGEEDSWVKHGDNPRFEQAVANAHLIAAAPDLYEAASSADQGITEAVRTLDLMGRGQAARDLAIYANNLRAALAKARGE